MAKEIEKGSDFEDTLKPFYQRASEAEARLSRLEAAIANEKDAGNEELLKTISELKAENEKLQGKLEEANTEVRKLTVENEKHKHRILHLIRAVREGDQRLESIRGHDSEATAETTLKLESIRL